MQSGGSERLTPLSGILAFFRHSRNHGVSAMNDASLSITAPSKPAEPAAYQPPAIAWETEFVAFAQTSLDPCQTIPPPDFCTGG